MDLEAIKNVEAQVANVQAALDDAQRVLQTAERAKLAGERAQEVAERSTQVMPALALAAIAGLVVVALTVRRSRHGTVASS